MRKMNKPEKKAEVNMALDSQAETSVTHQEVAIAFSGPLPVSSEFERYEKTVKGAGDRILRLTENEQEHRHLMELKMCELRAKELDINRDRLNVSLSAGKAELRLAGRGQVFVFALLFLFIVAILVSLYLKNSIFAFIFLATLLALLYTSGLLTPSKNKDVLSDSKRHEEDESLSR